MNIKKPVTFFEGVLLAFIISVAGSVVFFALSSLFSASFSVRLLISGLSFFYILYLLSRSKERIGRLTVILLWCVITIVLWFLWPTFTVYLLTHLLIIWLLRSIYFYSSLLCAAADLGLTVFSVATAFWVNSHTESLFLTLWCFFLTQALFVMIPARIHHQVSNRKNSLDSEADFQRAFRVAQTAVTKLSTHQ